jgi:hypothetical protein
MQYVILLFLILILAFLVKAQISQNNKKRKNKILFFNNGLIFIKNIQYINNYNINSKELLAIHKDLYDSTSLSEFNQKLTHYTIQYNHTNQTGQGTNNIIQRPKLYLIKTS